MSDQTEAELARTREVVAADVAAQSAAADAAVEPAPEEEATEEEANEEAVGWDTYTKDELVEELRNRELPVSGSKDELVARLDDDDAEGA